MKQEQTIFTKIINKEIPGVFIYEDDVCVVLMDKYPEVTGKCMVIPRKQEEYMFDLDDETYQHIFNVAKKIAKALDTTYETDKTALLVEGFEVPHVHIKLYPIKPEQVDNINTLLHGGSEISNEEALAEAKKIQSHL